MGHPDVISQPELEYTLAWKAQKQTTKMKEKERFNRHCVH